MRNLVKLFGLAVFLSSLIVGATAAPKKTVKTELFYEGYVVRTVVPPATMNKEGTDDFYAVTNGAEGQKPIAAVAPGDKDYHGGKWAFNFVTWNSGSTPALLTSEAAVWYYEEMGVLTVVRVTEMDFKCPIQP